MFDKEEIKKHEDIVNSYLLVDDHKKIPIGYGYNEILNLEDDDYNKFVESYNFLVKEANERLIQKTIKYVCQDAAMIRQAFSKEVPFFKSINNIPMNNHTAIYIPDFEESMIWSKLYGANTAFISEEPLRVVIHKELADKLTPLGTVFILSHEAQHFVRGHSDRLMGRNPIIWNIATDLIINYSLLNLQLPEIIRRNLIIKNHHESQQAVKNGAAPSELAEYKSLNTQYQKAHPREFKVSHDDLFVSDFHFNFVGNDKRLEDDLAFDLREDEINEKILNATIEKIKKENNLDSLDSKVIDELRDNLFIDQDWYNWFKKYQNGARALDEESVYEEISQLYLKIEKKVRFLKQHNINIDTESKLLDYNHIGKSHSIYENMKSKIDDKEIMEKEFGSKQDRIKDRFSSFVDEFGMPKNNNEKSKQKENTEQQRKLIREESRKIDINNSNNKGSSDIDEIYHRENTIKRKTKFVLQIENMCSKVAKSGARKVKSDRRTQYSTMTKVAEMSEMNGMGIEFREFKKKTISNTPNVLCIIDTSGSVSKEMITKIYLNELYDAVMKYDMEIKCVPADTEAKVDYSIILNKGNINHYLENGFNFSGGGGTDMVNPLARELIHAEKDYDFAIVLSDGEYSAFTRSQLTGEMLNALSQLESDKNKKSIYRRARSKHLPTATADEPNGKFRNPPIILLHTNERIFEHNESAFKTFDKNEMSEFLIGQKEENVIKVNKKEGQSNRRDESSSQISRHRGSNRRRN